MPSRFVFIDRSTPMLLPIDMQEWIQPDAPARLICELVEALDLSCAATNPHGTGSAQYPPGMMLALLLYSYSHGVFSSRQIEQMTHEHLGVRYICANHHPDHDTICKFRRENAGLIKNTFTQSLQLAAELGILNIGSLHTAQDGTKIKADVNPHATPTIEEIDQEIARIDQQKTEINLTIGQLLQEAEQTDQHEQNHPSPIPTELSDPTQRAEKIREAKELIAKKERREARLEAAKAAFAENKTNRAKAREQMRQDVQKHGIGTIPRRVDSSINPKKDKVNPADPDATKMKGRDGYIQGYNAQGMVDCESGLLVGLRVTTEASDRHQLLENVAEVEANLGAGTVTTMVGDCGYDNTYQVDKIEKEGGPRMLCEQQGRLQKEGAQTEPPQESSRGLSAQKRRTRERRDELFERMRTDENRQLRRRRKVTIEPTFGTIKESMGFRRFHLRGKPKVALEWDLVGFASNVRKLSRNKKWIVRFGG